MQLHALRPDAALSAANAAAAARPHLVPGTSSRTKPLHAARAQLRSGSVGLAPAIAAGRQRCCTTLAVADSDTAQASTTAETTPPESTSGSGAQLQHSGNGGPPSDAAEPAAASAKPAVADAAADVAADVAAGKESEGDAELLVSGAVADVEELRGVRVNVDDGGQPLVEYLVHWKNGAPDTWEPVENVAENLLRDYEDRWWKAGREGDEDGIKLLLGGGRRVLAQSVDENRRSALHFAAATGNARITRILCEAGAEVDLRDKDGYTPLHMAAGYLHTPVVELLLHYGSDPEIRDREGRNVLELIENLKGNLPPTMPQVAQRRFALDRCSEILTDTLYDELEPLQLLEARSNEDGSRDFLVQWPDDSPDSWVNEQFIAEDVAADFDQGLEYAEASEILRGVLRGDARQFLIRWKDSEKYPDSWEDEENVAPDLVSKWEAEGGAEQLTAAPSQRRRKQAAAKPRRKKKNKQAAAVNGAEPAEEAQREAAPVS